MATRNKTPMPIKIDRYEVIEELGRGGMGIVYRVRMAHDGRQFALKRLDVTKGKSFQRFKREFRVLQQLDHPSLVQVYEFGECDGYPYYVMELVEGVPLSVAFFGPRGRPSPLASPPTLPQIARAVLLMQRVCDPLTTVHQMGVIHRDLKPTNILVFPGDNVKLTDFGLVKLEDPTTSLTEDGAMVGTPSYMPPEIAKGKSEEQTVTERSDLYSVGVILYLLVSGRKPFVGKNALEVVARHLSVDPTPPRRHNPAIPSKLDALILQLLEKDPKNRPANAPEVSARLDEIYQDLTLLGVPAEPPFNKFLLELPRLDPYVSARFSEARRALIAGEGLVEDDPAGRFAWMIRTVDQLRLAGRYREALQRAQDVSAMEKLLGDRTTAARLRFVVGTLRSDLGDHKSALTLLKRAGKLAQQAGMTTELPLILAGAARVMARSGDEEKALKLFDRVDHLASCFPSMWQDQLVARLWRLWLVGVNSRTAIVDVYKALRMLMESDDISYHYRGALIAGLAYARMGLQPVAATVLRRAVEIGLTAHLREDLYFGITALARAYRATGDAARATDMDNRAGVLLRELAQSAGKYGPELAAWLQTADPTAPRTFQLPDELDQP